MERIERLKNLRMRKEKEGLIEKRIVIVEGEGMEGKEIEIEIIEIEEEKIRKMKIGKNEDGE